MVISINDYTQSVLPGDVLPEWWDYSNIWADHKGGLHFSPWTHGSEFERVYQIAYGYPVSLKDAQWMEDHLGSAPSEDEMEDETADNPGWQFNELAVRHLGWTRIKVSSSSGQAKVTLAIGTTPAIAALKGTLRFLVSLDRDATVETDMGGLWFGEAPRQNAVTLIRRIVRDIERDGVAHKSIAFCGNDRPNVR